MIEGGMGEGGGGKEKAGGGRRRVVGSRGEERRGIGFKPYKLMVSK